MGQGGLMGPPGPASGTTPLVGSPGPLRPPPNLGLRLPRAWKAGRTPPLPAVCRWRDRGQEASLAAPAAPGVPQQGRCSARVPPRAATPQPGPWAPVLAQSRDLGRCPLPALCPGTCGWRQEVGAGKPTGASRLPGPQAPFVHPKTQEPRAPIPPAPAGLTWGSGKGSLAWTA